MTLHDFIMGGVSVGIVVAGVVGFAIAIERATRKSVTNTQWVQVHDHDIQETLDKVTLNSRYGKHRQPTVVLTINRGRLIGIVVLLALFMVAFNIIVFASSCGVQPPNITQIKPVTP